MAESGEHDVLRPVLDSELNLEHKPGLDTAVDPAIDSAPGSPGEDVTSADDFDYGDPTIAAPEKSYFASSFQRHRPAGSEANDENTIDYQASSLIFINNPRSKHSLPRNLRDLGIILNSRRRNLQQTNRGAATAWIDRDTSGTYHPNADRATPPTTPLRRVRQARSEDGSDEDGSASDRECRPRRKIGWSFPMAFTFTSTNALEYLKSITPDLEDEKNGNASAKSDSGYGSLRHRNIKRQVRFGKTSTRTDGLTIAQLTNGHPQRRGCRGCFVSGDDDCSLIEHTYEYPCVACTDKGEDCEYIIPPTLKNSCERCKKKRIGCSYGKDHGEEVDSCEACDDAGALCCAGRLRVLGASARYNEVRLQPTPRQRNIQNRQFTSCNVCRVTGSRCNLRSRDQPGPCKHCIENGYDCTFTFFRDEFDASRIEVKRKRVPTKRVGNRRLSGPKPRKRRRGNSTPAGFACAIGQEWLSQPEGRRMLKRSSLGTNEYCKASRLLKCQVHPQSWNNTANKPFPLLGTTSSIKHVLIKTSFSHPVDFNHVPSPMHNTPPCTFCSVPLFGLFAYGAITVEIIPWAKFNGHGNEEISGGHADKNGGTRLCRGCTFARVKILGCKKHDIQVLSKEKQTPIEEGVQGGVDSNTNVVDIAEEQTGLLGTSLLALDNGDLEAGALALTTTWCSICPSPATHHCCAPLPLPPPKNTGCGLLLCEQCANLYAKVEKGLVGEKGFAGPGGGAVGKDQVLTGAHILDRTILEAEWSQWGYDLGVRADAEFLKLEGELVVRMKKGFGAGVEQGRKSSKENATVKACKVTIKDGEKVNGKEKVIQGRKVDGGGLNTNGKGKPVEPSTKGRNSSPTSSDSDSEDSSTQAQNPNKHRRTAKLNTGNDEITDPILRQVLMNHKVDGPFTGKKNVSTSKRGRGTGKGASAGRRRGSATKGAAAAGRSRGRGEGRGRGRGRSRSAAVTRAKARSGQRPGSNSSRGRKAAVPSKVQAPPSSKEPVYISSSDEDECNDKKEDDDEGTQSIGGLDSDPELECAEISGMEIF